LGIKSGLKELRGESNRSATVQKGALSIPLGESFSLKEAAKAHAAAEKGGAGKILLLV
jgi:hypothetical protein